MSQHYFNPQNVRFLLKQVHGIDILLQSERYQAYDWQSVVMLLDTIEDFSDKLLFPYIAEMDKNPSRFEEGRIIVHEKFGEILKQSGELGLIGAAFDEKDGGMQLPVMVFSSIYFIMESANNHVTGYLGLTAGAANLIISFGDDYLKKTFVPNMLQMKWGGTMCLTEPQAGSSLSDITTSADPDGEGTYSISGQKIFISSGDHQFADNFVHLVLARIKGAPAGTKGVSLFAVPKFRVETDGTLIYNHVQVAGEFDKLGQRGYCTTHLVFGEGGTSMGWLVGEPNKGLNYMFQMMNEARIATGRMGTGIATAAYHASLKYANERPQGRKLQSGGIKDINEEQTLIINHPDVKRMLLKQKAIVEGSLSLILQASNYVDKEHIATGEEKVKYHLLAELLTPIAKTYPSEAGLEAVSNGLQVLGGYGYMNDFILQQYYRDIRIISIYEGTTGIQSLDLLGRKVIMENGKALQLLVEEITGDISKATPATGKSAAELGKSLQTAKKVLDYLFPIAAAGNHERFLADATLFMQLMGNIVIAWQWLKIVNAASSASDFGTNSFLIGKQRAMEYFFHYELPHVEAWAATLMSGSTVTIHAIPAELE